MNKKINPAFTTIRKTTDPQKEIIYFFDSDSSLIKIKVQYSKGDSRNFQLFLPNPKQIFAGNLYYARGTPQDEEVHPYPMTETPVEGIIIFDSTSQRYILFQIKNQGGMNCDTLSKNNTESIIILNSELTPLQYYFPYYGKLLCIDLSGSQNYKRRISIDELQTRPLSKLLWKTKGEPKSTTLEDEINFQKRFGDRSAFSISIGDLPVHWLKTPRPKSQTKPPVWRPQKTPKQ